MSTFLPRGSIGGPGSPSRSNKLDVERSSNADRDATLAAMLSYAANHEDVRLARVLTEPNGLYLDIGAHHPVDGSVTKHFFDRGWRGVHVEPSARLFARFEAQRPTAINVHAAVGEEPGRARFAFFASAPGLSTIVERVANDHALMLGEPEYEDVEVTTLAALCEAHVGAAPIDLLVVDVEGAEQAVLRGADWARWRPRIVVVEATRPLTRRPAHEAWEPLLVAADYVPTAFDGCNRFYVASEAIGLAPSLAEPICAFDRYLDHDVVVCLARAARALEGMSKEERARGLAALAALEDADAATIASAFEGLQLGDRAGWLRSRLG